MCNDDCNVSDFQRQQQRFRELKQAINDRQSLNVIESIIDEDPAILEYQDEEKFTILHTLMTVRILPSLEIIELLVRKGPNALRKQNKWGNLPLHLACERRDCNVEIIKLLLDRYPVSVKEQNKPGSYPLHFSCFWQAPAFFLRNSLKL